MQLFIFRKANTDEHKFTEITKNIFKKIFVSSFSTNIFSNFNMYGLRRDLDFPSVNVVVSFMDKDSL